MTIGKKLHEALGMLDTLSGQFNTFALSTDDPQAQQMYESARNQLQQIRDNLNARIKYVESQEPQYRRQNFIGQQSQQQNQMSAQGTGQTSGQTSGQTTATTNGQSPYNAVSLGSSPLSTTMSSTSNAQQTTSQSGSSTVVTSTTKTKRTKNR